MFLIILQEYQNAMICFQDFYQQFLYSFLLIIHLMQKELMLISREILQNQLQQNNLMFIFFGQSKKMNQKKPALLVKNSFINFVLKTKIHKLTSFRHMNFYVLFTSLITNYFSRQSFFYVYFFVFLCLSFLCFITSSYSRFLSSFFLRIKYEAPIRIYPRDTA